MNLLKRRKKVLVALGFSLVLLVGSSASAYAYELWGYKWANSNVTYYYDNYNSARAKSYIASGASAWNSTDATYSFGGSYDVYATEVDMPNAEWDGLSNVSGGTDGQYFTTVTLSLNSGVAVTWNNDGALKSVAVHEFGHCLGLDENGTTKTIMNAYTWGANSRYGGHGITTPQLDDKNGVNSIY